MATNPTNPVNDPLHNPGVTPTPATPGYGPENVGVGGDKGEQKQFQLPGEDKAGAAGKAAEGEAVSPMQLARTTSAQRMTPEQLSQNIDSLRNNLSSIQEKLQDSTVTGKFSNDHYAAMKQVINKMNPDMRTIANETGGKFQAQSIQGEDHKGILASITHWISGSQQSFAGALHYLANKKGEQQGVNPATYLKLQYSIQRASQRAELFSSIISSSVSGIKTIMSTQLG